MTEKNHEKQSKMNAVRAAVAEIPTDKIREPNIPADVYLGEVQATISAAREHWHRFEAIGFPEKWLCQAEDGALAFGEVQAAWLTAKNAGRPMAESALVEKAYHERDEGAVTAGYVLRDDEAGRRTLSAIREGEGVIDCAQDLKDIAALIEANRAKFEAIRFDFGWCERACATSDELLKVRAANTTESVLTEAKALRDRIFTWTDTAVDEIRAAGLYVLRNEGRADWLAKFRSRYAISKARRNRAGRTTSAVAAANATTPTATTNPPVVR
jgi:hypothetical protein